MQFTIPGVLGFVLHLIKIPVRRFGDEISPRAIDAHGRDCHLDQNWFAKRGIETKKGLDAVSDGFGEFAIQLAIQSNAGGERLRELSYEIDDLVIGPAG